MKSLKLFLIFFAIAAMFLTASAEKVEKEEARTVARNFVYETSLMYYNPVDYNSVSFSDLYTEFSNDEAAYYIFNINTGGFVIIAAEDAVTPVLGYSMEGDGYTPATENQVFESWMQSYVNQIDYLRNNPSKASTEIAEKWTHYLNASPADLAKSTRSNRDVSPLLTNTWNQDYPYNVFCPEDENGPGGHAYAGCVATAMSMMMYHYKYPPQGVGQSSYYCYPYGTLSADFGSTYYQWDAMSDNISSSGPEHSIISIAELQYQCGVAVNMNYAPDGSGTYSYLVPNAIKEHFNYSNDAVFRSKENYTLTEWQDMVIESLENDHPLYYSGQSTEGGHAFCLDGNQGSMFHFNFGWSGSMNGYFPLEGADAVGGYNQSQGAVFNFYPPEDEYPATCTTDTLHFLGGTIDDGAMPYKPYATNASCSWLLVPPTAQDSIDYFEIDFLHFNLESSDYLRIYDGASEADELIGEFTGTTLPANFVTTNDSVLIVFDTDDNVTDHDGFRIEYKINLPSYCAGVSNFSEPTGAFDDGSGQYNYVNNAVCQYIINPQDASDLTIFFDEFDLGEGDRLIVYQTSPTQLLAELTSEDDPEELVSASGSMLITLQTDNLYNGGGFSISYQIGNIGTGRTEAFKEFTLFPNPAKDVLNVRLRSDVTDEMTLQITSMDGRTIMMDKVDNHGGTFFRKIDTKGLKPGIYMLNIHTEEGMATKKFIVE